MRKIIRSGYFDPFKGNFDPYENETWKVRQKNTKMWEAS